MRARLVRLLGWLSRLAQPRTPTRPARRARTLEQLEERVALSTAAPTACRCPYCCGAAYTLAGGNDTAGGDFRWPQPGGRGSPVTISYSYSNLLDGRLGGGLSAATIRSLVREALSRWAAVAPLNFVEVADSGPAPSDTDYSPAGRPMIRLGHRSIDGAYDTLAYGYFPGGTGLGGDIQFDSAETWTSNPSSGIDLLEVATHEIGHALGLGHEPMPSSGGHQAIMNPVYAGLFNGPGTSFLYQDDINGIRALYGAGSGSVTPLPGPSPFRIVGNVLYVTGTSDNDTLHFRSDGANLGVNLNGATLLVSSSRVNAVVIDLGGGTDTALLTGNAWQENVSAGFGGAQVFGSNYRVALYSAEQFHYSGNALDMVALYGSASADAFHATSAGASLSGAGHYLAIYNVANVRAHGGAGSDSATLHGTAGADGFLAGTTSAMLVGQGYNRVVVDFERVTAHSYGGPDTAYLYDSAGDDVFVATPTTAYLEGSGVVLTASGFAVVHAFASTGFNRALLFESTGNDTFTRLATQSYFSGAGFANFAHGFADVSAAAGTGRDTAYLYDSAGDDTFTASGQYGTLTSPGARTILYGFDLVHLIAALGGRNRRVLSNPAYTVTTTGVWE